VTGLLAGGELTLPPVHAWDVRRAREAFRFMSQARHAGKLVLTIPPDPAAPREPGTVLVTGGTGLLGGLVARHLAAAGRAGGLVLASRSGPAAPGVAAQAAGLAAAGTRVRVVACDAADRVALAGLLAQVPTSCPLTGVVHAARVPEGAQYLHELTRDLDLEDFVLFSSPVASAFSDGLASYRCAAGLPGLSLAWETELPEQEALGLLDLVAGRDEPLLVAARVDVAGLRAQATRGTVLPALWRGLIGGPARRMAAVAAGAGGVEGLAALRERLAGMAGPERDRVLLDLVRAHAAAVLGHVSPEAVEPSRPFKDLGFDSLTAVELRNRLNTATGLQLAATLIFDYPTPAVLAGYLWAGELQDGETAAAPVLDEFDRLESLLSEVSPDDAIRSRIAARLQGFLTKWSNNGSGQKSENVAQKIESATDDEIFEFINKELGKS
jgi:candicidin polyketide synthase FscB